MIIDGIRARNLASIKPEITFLDGGIGASFVTINIVNPPGKRINCDFYFYITRPMEQDVPQIITDYMETEVDIHSLGWLSNYDNSSDDSSSSSASSYSSGYTVFD